MLSFPTDFHKEVFEKSIDFLKKHPAVGAVSLGGSLGRGEGVPTSDVDLNAYLKLGSIPDVKEKLLQDFKSFAATLGDFSKIDKYFHVDLDVRSINIKPEPRRWTSGPDEYEVEIGNAYVHCELVFELDQVFTNAKKQYVPYYNEEFRQKRFKEVLMYLNNNIGHIEPAVNRGLYFHAHKRLHDANREFLQALFISRKIYPIAYDKWVKKQLVEILNLSKLHEEFVALYELNKLESTELIEKGQKLSNLINLYVKA